MKGFWRWNLSNYFFSFFFSWIKNIVQLQVAENHEKWEIQVKNRSSRYNIHRFDILFHGGFGTKSPEMCLFLDSVSRKRNVNWLRRWSHISCSPDRIYSFYHASNRILLFELTVNWQMTATVRQAHIHYFNLSTQRSVMSNIKWFSCHYWLNGCKWRMTNVDSESIELSQSISGNSMTNLNK